MSVSTSKSKAPTLPRVLMVAPLYHSERGGLGQQAKMLTERLADQGWPVRVVTRLMKGLPPCDFHPKVGIARLRNPRPRLHNYDKANLENLIVSLSFSLQLLKTLWKARKSYDMVHFHGASLPLILCVPLLKILNKPIIALVAGTNQGVEAGDLSHRYGPIGLLLAWILSKVNGYIALSPEIEHALRAEGYPESIIHRIPNLVDTERFRPPSEARRDELRTQLGWQKRRVLLFAGRLVALKACDVLLEAFREVSLRVPRSHLVIVGDGPEAAKLKALVQSYQLSERVEFLGFRKDIPELLGACDVFCLPSLSEGLPNVLLEAMACGRPVVASALGGCQAAVDPETGVLVPPGQAQPLAHALITLLFDRVRGQLMGQAGRHRIVQEFSASRIVRLTKQLYRHLLYQEPPPHARTASDFKGQAGCADDH